MVILILFNFNNFGQTPTWSWAKCANGNTDTWATGSTVDLDGNIYVIGYFYYTTITIGTYVLNSSQGSMFLVKYDSKGNIKWVNQPRGEVHPYNICTDSNNNIFITGDFYDTATFGSIKLTSNGDGDFFIARYDTSGNNVWAKSAGGISLDYGRAITADKFGNIYVTGNFSSDYFHISGWFISNTWYPWKFDIFIVKYDTSGNAGWVKSAGGVDNDLSKSITTDNLGNVYLTGQFKSPKIFFDSDTLKNQGKTGDAALFITKYSPNGNIIFVKTIGGKNNHINGTGITTDQSGNFYLTGLFSSDSLLFDSILIINKSLSSWPSNVFVAKYNSSGKIQWIKNSSVDKEDDESHIVVNRLGDIYLAGQFTSPTILFDSLSLKKSNQKDTTDIFVVKYDNSGKVIWAIKAGGNNNEFINSISLSKDDKLYITGSFESPKLEFRSTSLTNSGISNFFVAELTNCFAVTPQINIIGDTSFCEGDSTQLRASKSLSYLWSDLSITQSINVTKSGIYSVTVSYSPGCQATSAAVLIIVHPLPPVPIITRIGNDLKSTLATTYQWYTNDTIITGANTQMYAPKIKGNYKVEITDSNGCSSISDSFNYSGSGIFNPSADDDFLILIYPNPTAGDFAITFPPTTQRIEIINNVGQLIQSEKTGRQTNIKLTLTSTFRL